MVRHEITVRRAIALGTDAARVLHHFRIDHVTASHPSARIGSDDRRAETIAARTATTMAPA